MPLHKTPAPTRPLGSLLPPPTLAHLLLLPRRILLPPPPRWRRPDPDMDLDLAHLLPRHSLVLRRRPPSSTSLLFLTLYFTVVRNKQAFSRFVCFNAMQAVALDVLLIFPDLLTQSFTPFGGGIGLEFFQRMESTVFLFLLVCLVYGGGACSLGKTPWLPIVADAAERQILEVPSLLEGGSSVVKRNTLKQKQENNAKQGGGCCQ